MTKNAVLLLGLAAIFPAQAQQEAAESEPGAVAPGADRPEFAVWAGRTQSDNLARSVDGTSGTYDSVGVLVGAGYDSARVTGRFDSELEFRTYSDDSIDDETLGIMNGTVDLALARDVFFWTFREVYDQGRIDPFASLGPGNRDAINVFSTGPRLEIPMGSRMTLTMVGDYSAQRYNDSDSLDTDVERYDLSLFREVRRTMGFGLVASTNDTEYKDASVAPYTIDRVSLLYSSAFSSGGVRVQWGTNEISSLDRSSQEPLFMFDWSRGVGARSTLRFSASRQFSDTGIITSPYTPGVYAATEAATAGTTDVLLSSDPFEQKRFGVGYEYAATRTTVTLDVEATDDRYAGDSTFDNEALTTSLTLSRTVSQRLRFGFDFDKIKRDFADPVLARDADGDSTLGAWVDRSLGRGFSVAFVVSRYERSGTESFREDRVQLRFSYSPSGSSASALRFAAR